MKQRTVTRTFFEFLARDEPIPARKLDFPQWRHEMRLWLAMTPETIEASTSQLGAGRCVGQTLNGQCSNPREIYVGHDGIVYGEPGGECRAHSLLRQREQHLKEVEKRYAEPEVDA